MALNNVPLSGQSLDQTRVPINQNFSLIDSGFSQNHVSFNTPGAGKHAFVEFPTQSPAPTTVAGEVGLYCALSSITSQPELFFAHQMGSSAPTPAQIVEFTSAGWATGGWTRFPSGIMLKWNRAIGFGGGSSIAINLNTNIPGSPNYSAAYAAFIQVTDTAGTYNNVIGISSFTPTATPGFTVKAFNGSAVPGTVSFSYLAIGL